MKIDPWNQPDRLGFISAQLRPAAPPDACQSGCNRRRRSGRALSDAEIARRERFLASVPPAANRAWSFKPTH